MPFTPFHFGPSACVALPLRRYIDIPTFLLANIAIDIEPLLVLGLSLSYPLHGYAHTLLGASFVGLFWGLLAHAFKKQLKLLMNNIFFLSYEPAKLSKYIFSGILGTWFHVLLDSPLYADIKPFFPFSQNPLYGTVTHGMIYTICAVFFIPAFAIYFMLIVSDRKIEKTS